MRHDWSFICACANGELHCISRGTRGRGKYGGIFAGTWPDCTTVAQTVERSNGGAGEAHSNSHCE